MEGLDLEHPESINRGLRAQREAAGLTLRGLSGRSGYSTSYLSRVETGRRSAPPALVRLYTTLPAPSTEPAVDQIPKPARSRPTAGGGLNLGATWFGAEVRRRRMAAGKSLDALGAEVYLSRSYLGKIEQGDARGSYQLALSLDTALDAQGGLARLFLEECARIGPVAPDTDILARNGFDGVAGGASDPAELAAAAGERLELLRIRSHRTGPLSIMGDLGESVIELYNHAGDPARGARSPAWPVTLRYAELLGWTAQETGHDDIALRWTRTMADWARMLGDVDALGYALIRQSQWARRRGDAAAAVCFARQAGTMPGVSPRLTQFAAQREAQGYALARDEAAFGRALDRYRILVAQAPPLRSRTTAQWGPLPDPGFDGSRVFEATCLVDLGDFHTAATLFDQHMRHLGPPRTGYARLAVRQAISYAYVGEPEHACEIALEALPTVARQGSASLRSDLKQLTHILNRHRSSPAVRALLPDLTAFTRAGAGVLSA